MLRMYRTETEVNIQFTRVRGIKEESNKAKPLCLCMYLYGMLVVGTLYMNMFL